MPIPQSLDHALGPPEARRSEAGKLIAEARVVVVDEVAQHMDLFAPGVAADLNAGYNQELRALGCVERLLYTVRRVMIGDGDGPQAETDSLANDLGRWAFSVRCICVHVQVDAGVVTSVWSIHRVRRSGSASTHTLSTTNRIAVRSWSPMVTSTKDGMQTMVMPSSVR
jgi:hypothetical protein